MPDHDRAAKGYLLSDGGQWLSVLSVESPIYQPVNATANGSGQAIQEAVGALMLWGNERHLSGNSDPAPAELTCSRKRPGTHNSQYRSTLREVAPLHLRFAADFAR